MTCARCFLMNELLVFLRLQRACFLLYLLFSFSHISNPLPPLLKAFFITPLFLSVVMVVVRTGRGFSCFSSNERPYRKEICGDHSYNDQYRLSSEGRWRGGGFGMRGQQKDGHFSVAKRQSLA